MELWTFDIPAQSPRDFPPLSTNHRSSSANGTLELGGVTFFIIQGLTNLDEKKIILFSILLLIYIMILGGNSIIIYVALTDPKLNSPLYFFLCNLSFVDMVYTTTTIPNMLSGLLTDILTISVLGCFLQIGLKAFRTCAAHLTVVSISYAAASFVYISYRVGNFSPEVRIIVSVLYSALTPFLNPMIYSLRNKELRESIRRTLGRFRPAAVLPTKEISTLS
ncbi:unnamed protein product [Oreochromis niloticus]|nr:unnamed protein product [Mustela putorius furo]